MGRKLGVVAHERFLIVVDVEKGDENLILIIMKYMPSQGDVY